VVVGLEVGVGTLSHGIAARAGHPTSAHRGLRAYRHPSAPGTLLLPMQPGDSLVTHAPA